MDNNAAGQSGLVIIIFNLHKLGIIITCENKIELYELNSEMHHAFDSILKFKKTQILSFNRINSCRCCRLCNVIALFSQQITI